MPVSVMFWVFMIVVLITAFFVLLPKVRNSVSIPQKQIEVPLPPAALPQAQTPAAPLPKPPQRPAARPAEQTPQPPPAVPPAMPADTTPVSPPPASPPAERTAETRDRSIYFMQTVRGGAELRLTKTDRRIRMSDAPLLDCINALLAGPTAEESSRGLQNFIPPDTRILSAIIRGNTAYLSFNEEFQYNTFGREGSAAQIQQIVWTATEFPNVSDVQFLIEGSRVDFLTEGVMIGSPIGR